MTDRWLKVTLLISVTLNFLIIGAIAGFWISGASDAHPFPPHLGWIMREIDPEARQSLQPLLAKYHNDSQAVRQRMRSAQQQVNSLIIADPLDPAALDRSLAELRDASAASQAMMHGIMKDMLGQLNSDQRHQVLNSLNRNWRHEMRGPGKGRGRGRGSHLPPD
jgi:uncharacterized membrane protein